MLRPDIARDVLKTNNASISNKEYGRSIWLSFKQGEEDAFELLMELYYPALLNYGCRFYSDKEFVKDCIQDIFLDLWRTRFTLSYVVEPKSYLLVSLRRRLIREKSKIRWLREAKEIDNEYQFEVQFAIETYLINHEVQHEDLRKLRYSLEKLTKRQREAIYLRFFQELDYADIAQIMSITNHSAVNLVYEALKFIRKNWIYP
jgi:RNA polymerase sigma factor (sigma-70 family)